MPKNKGNALGSETMVLLGLVSLAVTRGGGSSSFSCLAGVSVRESVVGTGAGKLLLSPSHFAHVAIQPTPLF